MIEKVMYEFLEHGKRRRLKENTVQDYERTLRIFFGFIVENYPDAMTLRISTGIWYSHMRNTL